MIVDILLQFFVSVLIGLILSVRIVRWIFGILYGSLVLVALFGAPEKFGPAVIEGIALWRWIPSFLGVWLGMWLANIIKENSN